VAVSTNGNEIRNAVHRENAILVNKFTRFSFQNDVGKNAETYIKIVAVKVANPFGPGGISDFNLIV